MVCSRTRKVWWCKAAVVLLIALLFLEFPPSNAATLSIDDKPTCNGSIADCQPEDELFLDSDIHRRILQGQSESISNNALKRDHPVCQAENGNSYGTCLGPPSNSKYTQPCYKEQGCRGGA